MCLHPRPADNTNEKKMMTEEEQRYITDYLSGNMDPEERKRFSQWLKERPERQEAFRETGRTALRARWSGRWTQTDAGKAFARVQKRLHTRRLYRRMVQYAAVVLVAATAGIFLLRQEGTPTETPLVSTLPHPDNHRPVLTLHNGQSIVLSNEPQQVIAGTPAIDIRQTDSARLEYTPVSDTLDSEIHYNTLSVPKGCEFSLALADGTHIWVNAGSTLRYPERFIPGKREVFLSGEAYFEVAPDKANPFYVTTERMQLQVLGTSFDVSAYPDDPVLTTTLITGSVAQEFENGERVMLRPSWQSVYAVAEGTHRVQEADVDAVLAWKNGKFIARDERLEDILQRLSRWYDFQVVYTQPRLKDIRFHIHCERYENVMDILEQVQETYGIRFMEHNGTIYVSQ